MENSVCFAVSDTSRAGEARRVAVGLAQTLGFDETVCGQVALVVTETASNLARYATEGQLILRAVRGEPNEPMLEIIALDKGPGMANVEACLRDGYSTGGTPGTGLGAVQRLSPFFDIYSLPDAGTVQVSRFSSRTNSSNGAADKTPPSASGPVTVGAVCLPKPGETECGDSWRVMLLDGGKYRILVADGLGHGPLAATASREAVRVFEKRGAGNSLSDTLQAIHSALTATRGAAVAIAEVDTGGKNVQYVGVGNISGAIVNPSGEIRQMVSHNGTVGHQVRRIQEFSYPMASPSSMVVMASDGLSTQWRLDKYPDLLLRHPSLIAATLYRDFSRERDDATAVVARPQIASSSAEAAEAAEVAQARKAAT